MEMIFSPLNEFAVKPVCSFAKRHISYVVCESKLNKDLTAELKNLEDQKTEIDMRVRGACGKGKDIAPRVDKWVKEVRTQIEEVNQFLDRGKMNSGNKCSFGQCFLSICNHYKTGKKTSNMLNTLKEKLEEARQPCFTAVGISPPPSPPADMALEPTAYSKGYDSRESLLDKIIEALKVKDVIEIHGMAGVGKTVLVNRLAAEVKSRDLFDKVGIAVVSRKPNLAMIRNVIADRILHLGLHANSEEGKKDKLRKEIEKLMHQQKKVLLVLDDAWELLVLHEVGIPCPNKGFKIVVTSRFRHVCAQMRAEGIFEIRVLDRQEAWSLFRQELGDYSERLDSDEGYKDIAEEMVKHFNRLPLALVTLARALIGEGLSAWKSAANCLRERSLDEIDGMSDKVMGAIEISFNYLRDKEARVIFLLCCLFPEACNIEVEKLMKYGIGLGLFDNQLTLVNAMHKAVTLTEKLKSRIFLLQGDWEGTVKMHDDTRDTALHIATKGEFGFLVKEYHGGRINGVSNVGMHAISITSKASMMEFFLHNDVYPNLQILRLHGIKGGAHGDYLPHKFSTSFFEGTGNLKVLQMSNMGISSFPNSLGLLKRNLRTMCLHYCMVEDMTEVGELIDLEILDLRHSTICGGLRRAIHRLIGLRMLDLTFYHVNEFFDNLVGGLPQLEVLYNLGMTNLDFDKPVITRLDGLETLAHLKVLDTQVGRLEQLADHFLSILGNLSSFNICISNNVIIDISNMRMRSMGSYKILSFEDVTANRHLQQCLGQLLRVVDNLRLLRCDGFAPIMFCYGNEYLSNIRYLHLESCNDVEFVISGPTMKTDDQLTPFAKLEALTLEDLGGLKAILRAPSQHVDLSRLRSIRIVRCDLLPYVFTKTVARQLRQLKDFYIGDCGGMEEIFATSNDTGGNSSSSVITEGVNSVVLPLLQRLVFFNVPKLKLFSSKSRSHGSPSAFFGEQVQLSKLRMLSMRCLPLAERIWESQIPKGSFCQLSWLDIGHCMELMYIFSAAVALGLVQLKELHICSFDKLEEVAVIESGNIDEQEVKITFPRLHIIKLTNLKILHSFCSVRRSALEFPSLETVEISGNVANMQRFSYGCLHTPKLYHVLQRVSSISLKEEKIWKSNLNATVFHLYEERKRKLAEENLDTDEPSN